jgi:predicted  nucleic acid-binding Zn-ribbon protein
MFIAATTSTSGQLFLHGKNEKNDKVYKLLKKRLDDNVKNESDGLSDVHVEIVKVFMSNLANPSKPQNLQDLWNHYNSTLAAFNKKSLELNTGLLKVHEAVPKFDSDLSQFEFKRDEVNMDSGTVRKKYQEFLQRLVDFVNMLKSVAWEYEEANIKMHAAKLHYRAVRTSSHPNEETVNKTHGLNVKAETVKVFMSNLAKRQNLQDLRIHYDSTLATFNKKSQELKTLELNVKETVAKWESDYSQLVNMDPETANKKDQIQQRIFHLEKEKAPMHWEYEEAMIQMYAAKFHYLAATISSHPRRTYAEFVKQMISSIKLFRLLETMIRACQRLLHPTNFPASSATSSANSQRSQHD